MTDNEKIVQMQAEILAAVNRYPLPLAVKKLALENVLLNVDAALQDALAADAAREKAVTEHDEE